MTNHERAIFEIIQKNPFISQQEIANQVHLSRSSVANIISGLVSKGHLLGKAYIVNEANQIVCIGAANVDKKIRSNDKLKTHTSNPVFSTHAVGGVARNVAENLGRLGNLVSMISVAGNDAEWNIIRENSSAYINMDAVVKVEGYSTGTYTAILDESGEMFLGLADMSIYDKLLPDVLSKRMAVLQNASSIIVDLNCPRDTLDYLSKFCKSTGKKLIVITVSEPKMTRMPTKLDSIDLLVTNAGESGAYFRTKVTTKKEMEDAASRWSEKGVKTIIMTYGAKDLLVYTNKPNWFKVKPLESGKIVDVTGAGDSFSAAFIDYWLQGEDIETCVLAGNTNAKATIQSKLTVREDLTKEQLKKEMKEY